MFLSLQGLVVDLTLINVFDTAIKIGLGALISAVSGYMVLTKTHSLDEKKEAKKRFYILQDEKKSKYVAFLSKTEELTQNYLYKSCAPDSDEFKCYMNAFNEVQIISNDEVRAVAYSIKSGVTAFIFLNRKEQEVDIIRETMRAARAQVPLFQKLAQIEVTKIYADNE